MMLLVAVVLGLVVGAADVSLGDIARVFGSKIGITAPVEPRIEIIIWSIRLPRVLLGACVGASLALSGAALQGLFRNPLADPELIGISSGAAAAAALVLVLQLSFTSFLGAIPPAILLPCAAFGGGLLATVIVYRIASVGGRTSVATMLLAGIAINAAAGSLIGLMTYAADEAELRSLTLWMLGSLGAASWPQVFICATFLLFAAWALLGRRRELDALLLGEREAGDLGVDVNQLERRIVLLSALIVGASVAFAGLIGFIGLVAPHIIRLWRGPSHQIVLPGAMLLGAMLLIHADTISRTLVAPAELPIGIVTAIVGAPFFLYLLVQRRGESTQ